MEKQNYNVIGVMSGTSLDGIDLVYVHFEKNKNWEVGIKCSATVPYSDLWRKRLKSAIHLNESELKQLDEEYTTYLAETIRLFIEENAIEHLDFVASHGHTVFHEPDKGLTHQIGNRPEIAKKLGQKVVCDFRVDDVKLGGQGAPLVPIGDELLFGDYAYCLNLGGFANISFKEKEERIAFDICAVNTVLNHYVHRKGLEYDDGGRIAESGEVHKELLDRLEQIDFYRKPYPKSLGIEWVEKVVFPIIDAYDLPVETILRTYVEHVALQIGKILKPESSVLITGGGAYNTFLINRLREYCMASIAIPSKELVEFKEALIFGFLGVLKVRDEVNCLKSITGASKNHSCGRIFTN